MTVMATLIFLLALGCGAIYITYLRGERDKMNTKLKVFLSPGFIPWRVDKQVVEKSTDRRDSLDIVLYDAHPKNGQPLYPDLTNPRMVRVTITNRTQIKHVADCELDDEEGIIQAIAVAEERVSFLNAHKVK